MSNILILNTLNDLININTSNIIIVKVGAEWCKPCNEINTLYTLYANNNKNNNLLFTSINIPDADDELLDFIDVKTLPTFLIYENKQLKNKMVGIDKIELAKYINNL